MQLSHEELEQQTEIVTPINLRDRGKPRGVFPKTLPEVTPEQKRIRHDFMNHWLAQLPERYGLVERFNHLYPQRFMEAGKTYYTLDIGAGRGEHLQHEKINHQEYYALELLPELADVVAGRFPDVHTVVGDIQDRIDLPDAFFDRILAIHVLEHLPDLPRALQEVKRLLKPDGIFSVLIPCDPGLAYSIARNISARPMFEKRYKISYDYVVMSEHINAPDEIRIELEKLFDIDHQSYFPLGVPIKDINLIIGYTLRHKKS